MANQPVIKITNNLKNNAPLANANEDKIAVKKAEETKRDSSLADLSSLPVIVKDSSGNQIGGIRSAKADSTLYDALKSINNGESTTLYLDKTKNTFTNAPVSTMTFSDGKINLNVSEDVKNATWYRDLVDSDNFKDLAKLYANDPTGETKIEIEEDGNKSEKTINDLLQGYADYIEQSSTAYKGNVDIRKQVKKNTKGMIDLTDDDVIKLTNYQTFSKDNHNDSNAILLPGDMKDYFKDYESYKEDNGEASISANDFYSWFNLNNEMKDSTKQIIEMLDGEVVGVDGQSRGESDQDYSMDLIRTKAVNNMVDIVDRLSFYKDDMSDEEKAKLTTEYAKNYSLYQTMVKDTPGSDSWTGFNLFIQGVGNSINTAVTDTLYGAANLAENVAYQAATVTANTVGAIDGAFAFFHDLLGLQTRTTAATENTDENASRLEVSLKNFQRSVEAANGYIPADIKKSIDQLDERITNGEIYEIDFSKTFGGPRAVYDSQAAIQDLSYAYANTQAAVFVGRIIGYALIQTALINPAGEAVGAMATGLFENLSSATIGNMFSALGMIGSSSGRLSLFTNILKGLNNASTVGKAVGFAANMTTQGMVETLIMEPTKLNSLLYDADLKSVAEFQQAFLENIAWNIVGETVPFVGRNTIGKGWKTFINETKAGQTAQAAAQKTVNWFTMRGRMMANNLAKFVTRNSEEYVSYTLKDGTKAVELNPEKRWQDFREKIIDVQKQIEDTKITEEGGTDRIKELIQERIDLEVQAGVAKKLAVIESKNKIIRSAGLANDVKTLNLDTAEIIMLEKQLGFKSMPGTFSQETADYINDLYNKSILDTKIETKVTGLSKTQQKNYDILVDRITKFEDALPDNIRGDYITKTTSFLEHNQLFYQKLDDYLASDAGGNIIDRDKLKAVRELTGNTGKLDRYMPLMAVGGFSGEKSLKQFLEDPTTAIMTGKVTTGTEMKVRKSFSPNVIYADPNYTRQIMLETYAKIVHAADLGDTLVTVNGLNAIRTDSEGNILKTSKDVRQAKIDLYNDFKNNFKASIDENALNIGPETGIALNKDPKKYYNALKRRSESIINNLTGQNRRSLLRFASNMSEQQLTTIRNRFKIPEYTVAKTRAELDAMLDTLNESQQKILKKMLNGKNTTIANWNSLIKNTSLSEQLTTRYIKGADNILNSKTYRAMSEKAALESLDETEQLALKEAKLNLKTAEKGLTKAEAGKFPKGYAPGSVRYTKAVEKTVTYLVDSLVETMSQNSYLDEMLFQFAESGIDGATAKRFLALQWMSENIVTEKGGKSTIQKLMQQYFNSTSNISDLKISTDASYKYAEKFTTAAESIVQSEYNKAVKELSELWGENSLMDYDHIQKLTDKWISDITGKWESKQIIETWDRTDGKFKYYQVDRATYDLFTSYPGIVNYNKLTKFFARTNSVARAGQILLNVGSLVTQGFKDTMNAVVLGGWSEVFLDNKETYQRLSQYVSSEVVDAFSKEMSPSAWKEFLANAKKEGLTVEEAIVKSEISNAALDVRLGEGSTSSEYFRARNLKGDVSPTESTLKQQLDYYDTEAPEGVTNADTWGANKQRWQDAKTTAQEALDNIKKANSNVYSKLNTLHDFRETFLRKQVFRQNYQDALKAGKTLEQARNYAQFMMENATTNFARGVTWGSNIVRSIPYFGAALNGASSFVRMLEIDPVGVTGRFINYMVIPTVGLTVLSLQNETDAEIYRNIPEYEKEGNLIWVINGQVCTIPLPEEMAKFILPIRHFVEKAAGANNIAWNELLVNDLLNMPTVSINGIMALDVQKLTGDPDTTDRLSGVAMDLFNTLAPNAAKTVWIAVTGKDPYTGENYGRTKWFEDADGSYQLITQSDYDFCNDFANWANQFGWNVSATMAEGLLNSFIGTGSMNVIEGIRDLANGIGQGQFNLMALANPSLEKAGNVLTAKARTDETQATYAWYDLYYNLKEEKTSLLASDGKLAKYATDIDTAKTADELSQKTALYKSEVQAWQEKVLSAVKQYQEKYPNYFTHSRFASTISMLNPVLSIDSRQNSDSYYQGRADAVAAMYDAGFTAPTDNSIFGYVYRDNNTGAVTIKYTDPLIVSMTNNLLNYQTATALDKIEQTLKYSGLKDKYWNEIYPQINKYYASKNYTALNKLEAEWDVEVITAIKPIIDSYTVDDLLSNSEFVDLLDNYIKVPSTTEAMGKGKYYSSSTGLNKNRGYAGSYIKKIYKALKEAE